MKKIFYLLTPIICFSSLVGCKTEPNKYTVTWKNWDGSILETDEDVVEGSVPEYNGETPTKEIEDDFYFCSFSDWNKPLQEVHSDQIYIATFKTEICPDVSCIDIHLESAEDFIIEDTYGDFYIDWGDGSEREDSSDIDHKYKSGGDYSILIRGLTSLYCPSCNEITSILLGDSVDEIKSNAFKKCNNLKSIIISNSVKSIGEKAFWQCKNVESVKFSNSIKTIGDEAFSYCTKLVSIELPSSLEKIGKSAFYWCENLLNIVVPDNVTSIEEDTFHQCTSLLSVKMGSGMEEIKDVFKGCDNLELLDMTQRNEPPSLDYRAFHESDNLKILVQENSLKAYQEAPVWSAHKDQITDHLD